MKVENTAEFVGTVIGSILVLLVKFFLDIVLPISLVVIGVVNKSLLFQYWWVVILLLLVKFLLSPHKETKHTTK